jgi:hypothetical protein
VLQEQQFLSPGNDLCQHHNAFAQKEIRENISKNMKTLITFIIFLCHQINPNNAVATVFSDISYACPLIPPNTGLQYRAWQYYASEPLSCFTVCDDSSKTFVFIEHTDSNCFFLYRWTQALALCKSVKPTGSFGRLPFLINNGLGTWLITAFVRHIVVLTHTQNAK